MWNITSIAVAVWYRIWRLFNVPAKTYERCIVGSKVHPWLWCPRRSMHGTFVCRNHGVH
jgi:hypothetical protein